MSERDIPRRGVVGAIAVSSTAALACGLCCALPFALPAAALGSFGAAVAWLGESYRWMTIVAVLAVAAGWILVAWRSRSTRRRPGRSTLAVMAGATAVMLLALAWPALEPQVVALLGG